MKGSPGRSGMPGRPGKPGKPGLSPPSIPPSSNLRLSAYTSNLVVTFFFEFFFYFSTFWTKIIACSNCFFFQKFFWNFFENFLFLVWRIQKAISRKRSCYCTRAARTTWIQGWTRTNGHARTQRWNWTNGSCRTTRSTRTSRWNWTNGIARKYCCSVIHEMTS